MGVKPRFIVADLEVSQSMEQHIIVILSDIAYWSEHYDELIQWCKESNSSMVLGATLNIYDDQTLTAFCLRWA
jgi:hypothetical protein